MLKVGGGNVSAAEVESYLQRHPAIATVQVVSAPDDYYVEVPAAFVQLKPGTVVTGQEIIDFCADKIATFRCRATSASSPSGPCPARSSRRPPCAR